MAHEKVYAICEDKCREETLTKEEILGRIGEQASAVDQECKHYTDGKFTGLGARAQDGATSIQTTKSAITSSTSVVELVSGVSQFLDAVVATFNSMDMR